ncbi:SDR family oxidoreductase [Jannaschia aquimarina]|nr:SDR family oxidoreductase [Jannaschia aquimarina]
MTDLTGKTALVTGGSSGIGLAAAKFLAECGATAILTGRDEKKLKTAAEDVGGKAIVSDGADIAAIRALPGQLDAHGAAPDILILNAGFARFQPLAHQTEDDFDAQFDVLVKGPLFTVQALADRIPEGGSIVLITGAINDFFGPGCHAYGAAKAAAANLTRSLAQEMAPRGVRVNAVSPGPTETMLYADTGMPKEAYKAQRTTLEHLIPMGCFGTAEEMGRAIAWIASPEAGFVTGHELAVDGGITAFTPMWVVRPE